jgi:hypothetical protein
MTVIDDAVEDTPRRRAGDDDALRIKWSMVFQIVGYVIGLFLLWNAMTNRMTAMETAARMDAERTRSDINELKGDIKALLRKP